MPPHVAPAGALWDEADLVIAVGSDLDGVQTQNFAHAAAAALIAVNLDADDATKNYRVDLVLERDAADGCARAGRGVAARDGSTGSRALPRGARRGVRRRSTPARCASSTRSASRCPTTAIVVADMCIPGYWLAGFHTLAGAARLQIPLGWGTLGYAFPAALGAALAGAGPVVSRSPATAASCTRCGELATVAQERIPLTTVIVDDGGYGMLRYDQDVSGADRYGVDLHDARLRRARAARSASAPRRWTGSTTSSARRSPARRRPGAERAGGAHARAARAAAEHVAELVPPQA